jgi:hypothetical protein
MVEEEGVAERGFRCRAAFLFFSAFRPLQPPESYHFMLIDHPGFSEVSTIFSALAEGYGWQVAVREDDDTTFAYLSTGRTDNELEWLEKNFGIFTQA